MKLLVITQTIDPDDPVLGFFSGWLTAFSDRFGPLHAICLRKGEEVSLTGVTIHSLGKETIDRGGVVARLRYITRFWYFVWSLRKEYDSVFIHMNQEYVLLGGVIWRAMGKRVYFWRNHYSGNILTDIACMLSQKVFATSRFSYSAKFAKTSLMPVGVVGDIAAKRNDDRKSRSILFFGRLDTSKHPEVFINALGILQKYGTQFSATIVGSPSDPTSLYMDQLKTLARSLNIFDRVSFVPGVPNSEKEKYFLSHEIYVNCSRSGMLDKTIFEAAANGCLVLASSIDFLEFAGKEFSFQENDAESLADQLGRLLRIDRDERRALKQKLQNIASQNTLSSLIGALAKEMDFSTLVK